MDHSTFCIKSCRTVFLKLWIRRGLSFPFQKKTGHLEKWKYVLFCAFWMLERTIIYSFDRNKISTFPKFLINLMPTIHNRRASRRESLSRISPHTIYTLSELLRWKSFDSAQKLTYDREVARQNESTKYTFLGLFWDISISVYTRHEKSYKHKFYVEEEEAIFWIHLGGLHKIRHEVIFPRRIIFSAFL